MSISRGRLFALINYFFRNAWIVQTSTPAQFVSGNVFTILLERYYLFVARITEIQHPGHCFARLQHSDDYIVRFEFPPELVSTSE